MLCWKPNPGLVTGVWAQPNPTVLGDPTEHSQPALPSVPPAQLQPAASTLPKMAQIEPRAGFASPQLLLINALLSFRVWHLSPCV